MSTKTSVALPFMATYRATYQVGRTERTGQPVRWETLLKMIRRDRHRGTNYIVRVDRA
jgi:hypothetical protein